MLNGGMESVVLQGVVDTLVSPWYVKQIIITVPLQPSYFLFTLTSQKSKTICFLGLEIKHYQVFVVTDSLFQSSPTRTVSCLLASPVSYCTVGHMGFCPDTLMWYMAGSW